MDVNHLTEVQRRTGKEQYGHQWSSRNVKKEF